MTFTGHPAIRRLFRAVGGLRLARDVYRRRLHILMYHRFGVSGRVETSFKGRAITSPGVTTRCHLRRLS
jgi:hypothetical protein